MSPRPARMAIWLVVLAVLVSGLAMAATFWHQRGVEQKLITRGQRLFEGGEPMIARIEGHAALLPSQASRCVNCHRANAATPAFGPLLTGAVLTALHPRRGGPPSSYDETSFCKLLSTGIDPAHVMLGGPMPLYQLAPADCHVLWIYLLQTG